MQTGLKICLAKVVSRKYCDMLPHWENFWLKHVHTYTKPARQVLTINIKVKLP